MTDPTGALRHLAADLRAEDSVVSPYVSDPVEARPALGLLAAAGPRTVHARDAYALVIESVREGYLLHYERGRIVAGADRDLALLAGDYPYALGLDRLALLGDLASVRELSDLISLSAQIHDASRDPDRVRNEANALWLATSTAIAVDTAAHLDAKRRLREGAPDAAQSLILAAEAAAARGGIVDELGEAADSINFS